MEDRIQAELKLLRDIIVNTIPVDQIYLFGSCARGTMHSNSDIDILVIMPDDANIREIEAARLIHRAIRDEKTFPVDIVVSRRRDFDMRRQTPTIERHIHDEGIVLHE